MNNALLLLLLDSRAPAGAQHHSAAMEAAIMAGLVTDLAGTEDFCRTRLRTSAQVAASFAAASGRLFPPNELASTPRFPPSWPCSTPNTRRGSPPRRPAGPHACSVADCGGYFVRCSGRRIW